MDADKLRVARECKGFLDETEGLRLHDLGAQYGHLGAVVEIGSYCGKSSVYLGAGVQMAGGTLVCVDHHRGSEEHQRGEEYHDADLYDAAAGKLDTLGTLRRTLDRAGLEQTAVLLVSGSQQAAALCRDDLAMVFIDGGHSHAQAHADYDAWAPKVRSGGILAIHDLFPDPNEGGQAPIEIYRKGVASGLFEELETTKTLGVLRRR